MRVLFPILNSKEAPTPSSSRRESTILATAFFCLPGASGGGTSQVMTSFGVPILPSQEICTSAGANSMAADMRTCRSWKAEIAPVFSVSSLICAMSAAVSFTDLLRHDLGLRTSRRLSASRRAACRWPGERELSRRCRPTP